VIVTHALYRGDRFITIAIGEQALTTRQEITKASVLQNNWAPRGKIVSAAFAEPPAARSDITVFCDRELRPRSGQILLIARWSPCYFNGIANAPTAVREPLKHTLRISNLWFNAKGYLHDFTYVIRQCEEWSELAGLAAEDASFMPAVASIPACHGCKGRIRMSFLHRP